MDYKWIAQDKDGEIYRYPTEPERLTVSWFANGWESIDDGVHNPKWQSSLINLETHDYKIEDGVLVKVEKECKIFKGSELQYLNNDGEWNDCFDRYKYRIKPAKKTIRFRNYLNNNVKVKSATKQSTENETFFVKWIGDWQEVEIEND